MRDRTMLARFMRPGDPDPPDTSLRQRVARGMGWSLLQTSGSQLVGFAVLLVLARLLGPQEFGIVTAAFVVHGAVASIVDLGVGDVLVRRRPQDQADYDSAFWTLLGVSLLLGAALAVAARPIARLLSQPLLPPLLWLLAATLPLAVLEQVMGARMRSEMKFRPLALRALAATLVGGAAGIGLALAGAGYWSLLAKGVVEAAVAAALLWATCSYRPGRQWSLPRWRELFTSGRHVLGVRLIDIVALRFDALLVSARFGPAALGLYAAGQRIHQTLMQALFATVHRVTLPAFAQLQDEPLRMREALLRMVRVTSFFTLPAFAALAILAEPLVLTVLGSRWPGAAPILGALAVGGLLFSVSHFNAPMLTATGHTALLLRLMLVNAAAVVVATAIGSLWGAVGVALAFSLRGYLLLPYNLACLRRAIGLEPRAWLANLAPPLLATVASSALLLLAEARLLPDAAVGWRLLLLGALFVAAHALVSMLLIPGRAIDVARELRAGSRFVPILQRWQAFLRRQTPSRKL